MVDAAVGTGVRVPTPAGEVDVEVPAGTQPRDVIVVGGKGVPSLRTGRPGDLRVHVDVRVPRRLTPEQREQLLRLGDDDRRRRVRERRRLLPPVEERLPLIARMTTSIEAPTDPRGGTRRTGLLVAVPAAEPLVAGFRRRFDAASVARRIVPHVTVLFPFLPIDECDDDVQSLLRSHFVAQPAFDASLEGVESFPAHVWLRPEPRECFVDLIERTCDTFPGTPPYEGVFDTHVPHLSVGAADEDAPLELILETAMQELGPGLPVRFRVGEVTLFEEQEDGTWAPGLRFPLG